MVVDVVLSARSAVMLPSQSAAPPVRNQGTASAGPRPYTSVHVAATRAWVAAELAAPAAWVTRDACVSEGDRQRDRGTEGLERTQCTRNAYERARLAGRWAGSCRPRTAPPCRCWRRTRRSCSCWPAPGRALCPRPPCRPNPRGQQTRTAAQSRPGSPRRPACLPRWRRCPRWARWCRRQRCQPARCRCMRAQRAARSRTAAPAPAHAKAKAWRRRTEAWPQ